MNVIIIVLDSLRQDHVSLYHQGRAPFPDVPACQTPNLDRFAQDCVVFHNAYPEGLPTMPVRLALMTGQQTLPFRGWEPLRPSDRTIAQLLAGRDYVCGLISDVYHYRAAGMNYHRAFHAYRWIRGQEYDPYVSSPTAPRPGALRQRTLRRAVAPPGGAVPRQHGRLRGGVGLVPRAGGGREHRVAEGEPHSRAPLPVDRQLRSARAVGSARGAGIPTAIRATGGPA